MSLSNELNRWGLYGPTLSPKGKAQVLDYSRRAMMMENVIKKVLKVPNKEPVSADLRQELYDSIEDGRNES